MASSGDVLRALPQRRQLDPDDAERLDQVGAQIAARDPVVDPRRDAGDEAQVGRIGAVALAHDLEQLRAARRPAARSCPRDRRCVPGVSSSPSDGSERHPAVAHSIFTNGWSRRELWPWTARATDSRPVPRSPSTSTLQRLGAMRRTRASTSRMAGDAPNTLPAGSSSAGAGSGLDPAAGVRELAGIGDRGAEILFADGPRDEIGDAEPQRLRRRVRLAAIGDADDRDAGALNRRAHAGNCSASGRARSRTMTKSVSGCSSRMARACAACSSRVTVWPRRSSISGETLALAAVGGDQENGRRRAHFTRTCLV